MVVYFILDFDGTITLQDTGHVLFDNYGCGKERRKELDSMIGKEKSFREASEEMWNSLNVTLDRGLDTLKKKLTIDKDFVPFLDYVTSHHIPFAVISAGLKPLLRGALNEFLGPEESAKINIISNNALISKDGKDWKPLWLHDCELGHDKAKSIKDFKAKCLSSAGKVPLIIFIGDGVSDLAAASQADVLFARKGLKLEEFCIEHQIPYIPYDSFADIKTDLEIMIKGNKYHDTQSTPSSPLLVTDLNTAECSPSSPSTPTDEREIAFPKQRPTVARMISVGDPPNSIYPITPEY